MSTSIADEKIKELQGEVERLRSLLKDVTQLLNPDIGREYEIIMMILGEI